MSENTRHDPPVVIDLFSGAGGTALGFVQAGFRILAAVENNPDAAKTYLENIKVSPKTSSIVDLDPRALLLELGLEPGELDVLMGCPPCQGFTRLRNQAGGEDPRNALILNYLEFVRVFLPRFAVFENVPGLQRTNHGRAFYERLLTGLKQEGYILEVRLVDAADYGIPQHRRRIIIVAGRGQKPPFPERTHAAPQSREVAAGVRSPWRTVEWAIRSYPRIKAGENGEMNGAYPNHVAPKIGKRVLRFIRAVPQNGGSRKQVREALWLECHRRHDGHKDVYGRLAWDRPANTITSGCTNPSKGRFVHPEQNRGLTPREAAKLQGFPDSFRFYGGMKSIASQIGNAVPPPLAEAVAVALLTRLRPEKT